MRGIEQNVFPGNAVAFPQPVRDIPRALGGKSEDVRRDQQRAFSGAVFKRQRLGEKRLLDGLERLPASGIAGHRQWRLGSDVHRGQADFPVGRLRRQNGRADSGEEKSQTSLWRIIAPTGGGKTVAGPLL